MCFTIAVALCSWKLLFLHSYFIQLCLVLWYWLPAGRIQSKANNISFTGRSDRNPKIKRNSFSSVFIFLFFGLRGGWASFQSDGCWGRLIKAFSVNSVWQTPIRAHLEEEGKNTDIKKNAIVRHQMTWNYFSCSFVGKILEWPLFFRSPPANYRQAITEKSVVLSSSASAGTAEYRPLKGHWHEAWSPTSGIFTSLAATLFAVYQLCGWFVKTNTSVIYVFYFVLFTPVLVL